MIQEPVLLVGVAESMKYFWIGCWRELQSCWRGYHWRWLSFVTTMKFRGGWQGRQGHGGGSQ